MCVSAFTAFLETLIVPNSLYFQQGGLVSIVGNNEDDASAEFWRNMIKGGHFYQFDLVLFF